LNLRKKTCIDICINKKQGKRDKMTLIEKASGNNVSGFIASSGKLRKACISFSKGNFT